MTLKRNSGFCSSAVLVLFVFAFLISCSSEPEVDTAKNRDQSSETEILAKQSDDVVSGWRIAGIVDVSMPETVVAGTNVTISITYIFGDGCGFLDRVVIEESGKELNVSALNGYEHSADRFCTMVIRKESKDISYEFANPGYYKITFSGYPNIVKTIEVL